MSFVLLVSCMFLADASISALAKPQQAAERDFAGSADARPNKALDLVAAADEVPAETKGKKGKGADVDADLGVDDRFLSPAALADLFSDTQISHVSTDSGADVIMFFHADGRISGSSTQRRGKRRGTTAPVDGNWNVSPLGQLCVSSEQHGMRCGYLARSGPRTLKRHGINKAPLKGVDFTIVKPGPRAHLVLGE